MTCHPETGTCSICLYGTGGDHCERCAPNVKEPDCNKCIDGFYGFADRDFDGCRGK